ncbi:MAG: glycosyltransferase family 4 protein [Flavobacteriales bacterium CG_4_9_14_0_2_um_filter_32_27]|nr:MAG: glycosyltransferase family 4 protein [Flavobacteriales bacterium CG_4_9_14_0_2_um_filter_32_27]
MKIVILGDNVSVHIQKWINAIAQYKSIELHIVSFEGGAKFENVIYHNLKRFTNTKLDYFLNAFNVKSLIKSIQPNIIHSHYATSYGFLGAFSGFHPFIITGWGADIFDSPKSLLMKILLKYSFRKADKITVLTEVTRKEIKHLTNKPVSLIPFGVDLDKFKYSPENQEKEIIRIGTIRTLSEKYGIEYLIRAFANLYHEFPHLHLDIVGDGPLMSFLKNLTIELGVADRIIFHGYVNQNTDFDKYIELFNSFEIFTILSILDSETFGVAAVEASACGKPVIATNVGGLPEVIDDGITGLIVAPKNVAEITQAIKKLVISKTLRTQLGQNGRKKVEEKYNWETNVKNMIHIYEQLTKKDIQ